MAVAEDDPGRCVAVYDWDMCTLGDPLTDLGTLLALWSDRGEAPAGTNPMPTQTPGFLTREEAVERYGERSGRDVSSVPYYDVFGTFKMAVVAAADLLPLREGPDEGRALRRARERRRGPIRPRGVAAAVADERVRRARRVRHRSGVRHRPRGRRGARARGRRRVARRSRRSGRASGRGGDRGEGRKAHAERLDVADGEAVRAAIESAAAREGRLDYVFNNAGIAVSGEVPRRTLDDWRRILDVNLRGVIHGVRAAYPLMVASAPATSSTPPRSRA